MSLDMPAPSSSAHSMATSSSPSFADAVAALAPPSFKLSPVRSPAAARSDVPSHQHSQAAGGPAASAHVHKAVSPTGGSDEQAHRALFDSLLCVADHPHSHARRYEYAYRAGYTRVAQALLRDAPHVSTEPRSQPVASSSLMSSFDTSPTTDVDISPFLNSAALPGESPNTPHDPDATFKTEAPSLDSLPKPRVPSPSEKSWLFEWHTVRGSISPFLTPQVWMDIFGPEAANVPHSRAGDIYSQLAHMPAKARQVPVSSYPTPLYDYVNAQMQRHAAPPQPRQPAAVDMQHHPTREAATAFMQAQLIDQNQRAASISGAAVASAQQAHNELLEQRRRSSVQQHPQQTMFARAEPPRMVQQPQQRIYQPTAIDPRQQPAHMVSAAAYSPANLQGRQLGPQPVVIADLARFRPSPQAQAQTQQLRQQQAQWRQQQQFGMPARSASEAGLYHAQPHVYAATPLPAPSPQIAATSQYDQLVPATHSTTPLRRKRDELSIDEPAAKRQASVSLARLPSTLSVAPSPPLALSPAPSSASSQPRSIPPPPTSAPSSGLDWMQGLDLESLNVFIGAPSQSAPTKTDADMLHDVRNDNELS